MYTFIYAQCLWTFRESPRRHGLSACGLSATEGGGQLQIEESNEDRLVLHVDLRHQYFHGPHIKDMKIGCTCNSTAQHETRAEFLWEILTENGHFSKINIRHAYCKNITWIKQDQKIVLIADFGYGVHNAEDLACKELLIINQYEPPIQWTLNTGFPNPKDIQIHEPVSDANADLNWTRIAIMHTIEMLPSHPASYMPITEGITRVPQNVAQLTPY